MNDTTPPPNAWESSRAWAATQRVEDIRFVQVRDRRR